MALQSVQILPNETWLRIIAENLSYRDLYVLRQVNRFFKAVVDDDYIWRAMLLARYGEEAVPDANQEDPPTCREVYEEKAQQLISVPNKFCGAWFEDTRYWRMNPIPYEESLFGKIAYLHMVWWLDVWTIVPAVAPGEYMIVWRMQLHQRYHSEPMVMYATPEVELQPADPVPETIEYTPSSEWRMHNRNAGWVYMVIPQRLVVEERHGFTNIKIGVKELRALKQDISFDYVQLVDVTGRSGDIPPPRTFILNGRRVTQV